jgi:hypothetical protein
MTESLARSLLKSWVRAVVSLPGRPRASDCANPRATHSSAKHGVMDAELSTQVFDSFDRDHSKCVPTLFRALAPGAVRFTPCHFSFLAPWMFVSIWL